MSRALVGFTGFVGSNLNRQFSFDERFRSTDIDGMSGRAYDLVVCAGIQAKKWWANQHPEDDWRGIQKLLDVLGTVKASFFILISTVDVYPDPAGVDEATAFDHMINHAYGKHRFLVEEFVREKFKNHLILRLPGLFGNGIKKNVIHDLLTHHELEKINPAGVYQYYFLDRLSKDIARARAAGISLLNVSAEPVSTQEIIDRFFPGTQVGAPTDFRATYDMLSRHWKDWGSTKPGYLYDKATVLSQLAKFLQRVTHQTAQ
ncbi:MAG: hypothetical protein SFU53_01420 [Terrimicrobiaceae bacterium]|nr:hypothetical protein [Terrimicrobiaceae bacterium]